MTTGKADPEVTRELMQLMPGQKSAPWLAPERVQPETVMEVEAAPWPPMIRFDHIHVERFPVDLLRGFLGDYVRAVATATETPPELATMLGLAVAAACVAGKIQVSPEPDYVEPVNIFVAVGMESGNRKSAVLSRLVKPLTIWETEQAARVAPERGRLLSERKTRESQIAHLRKKAAALHGSEFGAAKDEIAELEGTLPVVPAVPRLIVQDVTPERLATVMAEQGERIALLSDEGGIFDLLAGRYNKGIPNLDLFLQGHAGTPVRIDRADTAKPPVRMDHPALTVGLSPQPDVLQALKDKPGFRGRGLLARFLYALPDSPLGDRALEPEPVCDSIKCAYETGIFDLLNIDRKSVV